MRREPLCGPDADPDQELFANCVGTDLTDYALSIGRFVCTGGEHRGEEIVCTHECHDIPVEDGVYGVSDVHPKLQVSPFDTWIGRASPGRLGSSTAKGTSGGTASGTASS